MKILDPQLDSQSRHSVNENSIDIGRKARCINSGNIAITSLKDQGTCRQTPELDSSQILAI